MLSAVSFAGSYSQDFNDLPDAGTSFFYGGLTDLDARPINAVGMAGWQLHKAAGQSDFVTFVADSGNSASSSMRSFGAADLPDRALGSIANELGSYAYGVTLTNDTGGALTSFTLTFAGEHWQESGALAAQTLRFEYALGDGVSLEQGTFVAASALDFVSPQHSGAARTLDGNDAANRTLVTATISGIMWAPGEELVLRWSDSDDVGADHGLGIDDLTLTAAPLNLTTPAFAAGAAQTLTVPENSSTGTIVGLAAATDPDAPVEPLSYAITAGAPSGAFAIDANGQLTIADAGLLDLDFENGDQVAVLTVQVTDGANLATQSVTVNVLPLNDNAPLFATAPSLTVAENDANVITLAAADADLPSQSIAFTISGGADAPLFTIVNGNELKLLAGLDFESPTDADADGVYLVEILADDGQGGLATLALSITVTDVDETPPLLAFWRSPSTEQIDVIDEAFGEAETFPSAVAAALLA